MLLFCCFFARVNCSLSPLKIANCNAFARQTFITLTAFPLNNPATPSPRNTFAQTPITVFRLPALPAPSRILDDRSRAVERRDERLGARAREPPRQELKPRLRARALVRLHRGGADEPAPRRVLRPQLRPREQRGVVPSEVLVRDTNARCFRGSVIAAARQQTDHGLRVLRRRGCRRRRPARPSTPPRKSSSAAGATAATATATRRPRGSPLRLSSRCRPTRRGTIAPIDAPPRGTNRPRRIPSSRRRRTARRVRRRTRRRGPGG